MRELEGLDGIKLTRQRYFTDQWWTSSFNYTEMARPATISENVSIHDVTLRDGEQTPGVVWLPEERAAIAQALSDAGVGRIEAGMPIVSPETRKAMSKITAMNLKAKIIAFARANRDDINAALDTGVQGVIVEHTVNPYLCKHAYGLQTTEELIDRLATHISYAKENGLFTVFMGWDFFRSGEEHVKRVYKGVVERAAPDSLVIVDTFGVATPFAVYETFLNFKKMFPGIPLEFHVHNDFGLAGGSALAAVCAGADVIHTAVNGLGERTGNLALEETVAALEMLLDVRTGVDLSQLTRLSRLVEEISKVHPSINKPVVGRALFDIAAGIPVHYTLQMAKQGVHAVPSPFVPQAVGQEPYRFVLGQVAVRQ